VDVDLFTDARGEQPVALYIEQAVRAGDAAAPAQLERLVDQLESSGPVLRMPYARIIDRAARIYELRFGPHRVAYLEHTGRVVLLHGWRKRTQDLDRRALATARRRAAELGPMNR
jgi:phage-related protein